jgi:hypothetical protein
MIETMTAMTTATMAIVRAFMGRLPGLQQRSRRPYSVSRALSPEPRRAASRSAASSTRSAVGCGSAPRVRASPFSRQRDATGPPDATSRPRSLGWQALADALRAGKEPVCCCCLSNVSGGRFETPNNPDPRARTFTRVYEQLPALRPYSRRS